MEKYDILEWEDYFEKTNDEFDLDNDAMVSNSIVLYPGRFYVLDYVAKTKDVYNMRPVIISLGISKKEPDKFLCLDLSILPKKIRLEVVRRFFNVYYKDICDNMDKYPSVEDADKQEGMKTFTYGNLCRMVSEIQIKNAVKKYKIENTRKIYSLPFNKVYRVIGKYCDTNFYMNGNVADIQKEFLKNAR